MHDAPHDDESSTTGRDRFVHGVLTFMHRDSTAVQSKRIDAVMAALDDEGPLVLTVIPRRRWMPLAALVSVLIIGAVFIAMPSTQPAYAVIASAIEASSTAPDRRYSISVEKTRNGEAVFETIGQMDLRGTFMRLEILSPEGHAVVVGRDAMGDWVIRRDGLVDRYAPERARPKWLNMGENTVLTDSVDALLKSLPETFDLHDASGAS
ncbi:MAG: hypothetical protein AAF432_06615, partial [Planctomycetota bacterium]